MVVHVDQSAALAAGSGTAAADVHDCDGSAHDDGHVGVDHCPVYC